MRFPKAIEKAEQILTRFGGEAYIVGGCVRDALLDRPCHDYDLTTNLPPEHVIEAFTGYTVIPTGLRHGTVTVHIDGLPIDITTYRIDGTYTDGRHPVHVRFSTSLEDDLRRRDFTMNAVCYSTVRGFVDPFGGVDDIRAGISPLHWRSARTLFRRCAAHPARNSFCRTARLFRRTGDRTRNVRNGRRTGAHFRRTHSFRAVRRADGPYADAAFTAFHKLFKTVLLGCAAQPVRPLDSLPADKAVRFAAVLKNGASDSLAQLKSDRRTVEDVHFLHAYSCFSSSRSS